MITLGTPTADSEAIGEINVFLSQVMRGQEEGEGEKRRIIPGLGTRTGCTLLFSTTGRFCDMKQTTKLRTFVFSFN